MAIVCKGYERNDVDLDPYKDTGTVTASQIEEKLREKFMEMSGCLRDSATRFKIAKEKLIEAREREVRTKDYRKELRVRVIQTEENLKLKERVLRDLEEQVRYKDTFAKDSRKMSSDMTETQIEVDRLTIQLSAAKRKYNESYLEWQKMKNKPKDLDKKLREKEKESGALRVKTEQLQLRLQTISEEKERMQREHDVTKSILQQTKDKNHELKVKYKEAWERKLEAMKKIADLEARVTQITQMTDTVRKDRVKAEEDLMLGIQYTKFDDQHSW